MTQRRCVGCGLRADVQGTKVNQERCPRCGVDWVARPPRSYAELEGFELPQVVESVGVEDGGAVAARGRTRVLRLLEVGLFAVVVVLALVIAAANIVGALRGDAAAGL